MRIFTKEELSAELKTIVNLNWISNTRQGNHGDVGNTLEDLLGIEENNLPIPNASEWELKTGKIGSTALTTMIHKEPSPQALRFVPSILLPNYGWSHQEAGGRYPISEKSFRQTIHAGGFSNRGFRVKIDRSMEKIEIVFDSSKVDARHSEWLLSVEERAGLGPLDPQPYWGFRDLEHSIGSKLLNCFYVQARTKREGDSHFIRFERVLMLEGFDFPAFLNGIETGSVLVDFDARTGHNHGTKFRLRQNYLPSLYEQKTVIV